MWAPKARYPYTEANVSVKIVEHRRASANSESEELSVASSADAKGDGSKKRSRSARPCDEGRAGARRRERVKR
eukprot:2020802-Pleurochrysis_carterae.AAC.1